jgi:hypothetical protein
MSITRPPIVMELPFITIKQTLWKVRFWNVHDRATNCYGVAICDYKLSNGPSTANLLNSSTRQNFSIFVKFEYSPKLPFSEMCQTRQTRRHSPNHVARICQTRRHSPSRVARTRQTRERWVWRVLREFGESGESGQFGECRLDHFMHINYVIFA